MPGKVTIATVAGHAQVSRQTVSNVINAPHLVRQETRDRVREAIESLGYRASQAARQMRTGRSGLIAARIGPAGDRDGGFLHALTEAAAGAGYRIVLYTATGDEAEVAAYDELLARHGPDGFVLTGTHHGDPRPGWLAGRGVAFVTFGRPWGGPDRDPGVDHPWVGVDGARGVRDATERLLAAGHRRVGFIGWPAGNAVGDDRRAGWHHALRAAGLDPTGLLRRTGGPRPAGDPRRDDSPRHHGGPGRDGDPGRDESVEEGERAATELLAGAGATALVCASDGLALGALRAVGARPAARGTAVIGFGDTPVAGAAGLTSVGRPLAEAAAACVAVLTRLLDDPGRAGGHEHVLLRPRLVVRDSG